MDSPQSKSGIPFLGYKSTINPYTNHFFIMSDPYTQAEKERIAEDIGDEIFREHPEIIDDSPEYEALFEEKWDQWQYQNNNPALTAYERSPSLSD